VDEESELRPLPPPPRCRGIPLGDGNYTGCEYGYGDVAPFTGPRDCPVCDGSGFEGPIETTLPHSDFGDPDCCGCLSGVIRGDQADIVCNECGTVLRTVPVANVKADADRAGTHARGCQRSLPALRIGESVPRAFPECSQSPVGSAERPFCVQSS